MIEIKTYSKPKKTGGSGGSSSTTKYISGVISEAEHAGRADKAKRAEVADQANYAGTAASAQNAAYASEAGNLHADAEILQKYLSLEDTVDPQVVKGMVIFAKGLIAKALVDLEMGAKFGNNAKITNLGEAVFSVIKSLDYDNAAEQGFSVEKEKSGKYHAFFTNLTIWGKARFHELEVRKLSYSGGNIYLSGAGSKLIKVVPVKKLVSADGVTTWVEMTKDDAESECAGWKCYLLADNGTTATMNDWQEGDQARCQTMGEIAAGGAYSDVSNKSYWRTIPNGGVSTQNEKIYGTKTETYIDEDGNEQTRPVQVELYDGQAFAWIVIGKHSENFDGYTEDSAPDETKDIPAEGDTIVLDGNRHRNEQGEYDKTDRQNVIILETTGEYAPRIACYANITEYKHTFTKSVNGSDKEVSLSVFETSPKGGTKINSSRFEWTSDDGSTINIINYRGDWSGDNKYHKNDQVNHNNAVWVCVANSGVDVTEEPRDGVSNWKKVLSGGKGEKGDKGEDGLSGNGIVPVYTRSDGTPTPPTSTDKNNLDNGWSLAIPSVADVKNVSYGDSSWMDYNDDSGCTWKKSPITADSSTSSCLVTFTTTKENQVVKFVIKSFSEPRYDYIFLSEIDAASVPSRPTSNGWYRAVSGNGVELSVIDIIATAGTHTVYVCYGKDNSSSFHGDYGLFRIEKMTDIDIPLWQSNGTEVFTRDDSGSIKSEIESWSEPFKVTGENGEDAVSYTVTLTRGSNGTTQGLYVGVTRYIGTACTTGTIIDFGMSCKAYTDGTLAVGLTDRLQTSDNYIDFAAFPKAKSFTVELLDKNGNKVATGNYSSGDDAISILVEDAPLVFDTDDNGIVSPSVTKTAKVKVMRGNTNVTNDCTSESSRDDLSLNCGSVVTKKNGYIEVSVSGGYIVKNDIIVDGVNQGKVSTTSGYAVAQFVYDSVTYFAQVPFSVNVAKFTGSVSFDNKRYKAQFDELSNGGGAATKDELKDVTSTFEQTAREISLSVSEKSIGRRNLLVGSAFQRDDNNVEISDGARIEMNSGYQGTNCIHIIDDTDGTPHYPGAFWDGSQGGKSIEITKGKKYIISCWYMTNDVNGHLYLEALYTDKQTNAKRKGGPNYLSPSAFTVKKVNEWELFTAVIDTTDAQYNYLAFNFFESCNGNFGRINAWICRPMVEEGDTYNGWTLSQDDYDYIGGNMLDNTLSLDKSGSLYDVNGALTPAGFGESTSIYKSFTYKLKGTVDSFSQLPSSGNVYDDTYFVINDWTCYAYNGSEFVDVGNDYYYEVLSWRKSDEEPFGLEANKDYVFSFMAKGTGRLTAYFYYPDTDVFIEDSLGGSNIVVNGQANFQLTNKWERYWVHWRPSDSLHRYIILRLGRTIQSGAGDAPITNCYIAQPKLEEGAVVTEYTERKSDLIDKASLKAAGILVDAESVTLYGNQVHIKKNKTDANDTVLIDNETGKVSAGLIDADEVVAKGIRAKNLEATNLNVTGNSKFGIWEIRKDDTFGEMIQARGDLQLPSGHTAQGSGVQYLPLYIRGGLANANYFRVGVSCTEFSYSYNGRDFCGVWTGKAADYVCGSVANTAFNTPTEYGYDESYHPAEYIYTTKSLPNDPALAINVVKTKGSSNGERTAIQTNAAIRGVLAPNSMSISWNNDTIPSGIGVVICTNGSEITLTLPANPIEGQTLIIIQGSDKRVYIVPYGDEVIYCSGQTRDKSNKFFSGMIGQFNIFVFIRGNWQLQFVNNRA